MRRRLLVILKNPEFDDRNEVVLGQCEPFTRGWRLVMMLGKPGEEPELLLNGLYTDLRRVQETCSQIDDPAKVRLRVESMKALMNSAVTETVIVPGQQRAPEQSKIMEPTQTALQIPAEVKPPAAPTLSSGLFEARMEGRVLVGLLADPEQAADLPLFNRELGQMLGVKPDAILLDLSRVQNLALRAMHDLAIFQDQCTQQQIPFALCNLRKSLQKLMESMGQEHPPKIFNTLEEGLKDIL